MKLVVVLISGYENICKVKNNYRAENKVERSKITCEVQIQGYNKRSGNVVGSRIIQLYHG